MIKRLTKRFPIFVVLAVLWLTTSALPLEKFVADRNQFSWEINSVEENASYKVYWLNMTSQIWEQDFIQKKTWTHVLKVTVPHAIQSPMALFAVQGGKTGDKIKDTPQKVLEEILATGTILAELKMVPNQPLLFIDEKTPRIEDEIVARTWRLHLENKESLVPLHFPMVKAIVRGIDALSEFLNEQGCGLDGVILVGESKRGWAAWLAAAVDSRVKGIIPIVCDFLNVRAIFEHQLKSLGTFSLAVHDYLAEGIDNRWFDKREFRELMELIDPLAYSERYTMPKLQINASGDPFSMPDTSQFSFAQLPAPKYLRYIPNAGHYLQNTDYMSSVVSFYRALIRKQPLPSFRWHRTASGELLIDVDERPLAVKVWKATNPDARDFRWDFTRKEWTSFPIAEKDPGVYLIDLPAEPQGWAAYFAELEFEQGLIFTTEVFIVPDRFPSQ